ncbi:MAG: C40 family peptidase, partial [Lachnospiraceae bacterium]|nr:C40 family peptidase [Lachnospiraceae bacterium]
EAAAAQAAQEAAAAQAAAEAAAAQEAANNASSNTSSNSALGQQIVNTALQYVGYPYVYGGNSLTGGIDCSGFTQQIYAMYGISLPRSSYSQRNVGYAVSYAEAQPGDLICYDGHVAIYMGGGSIVHASNEINGICVFGNANYRSIVSVRRLV